MTGQPARSVPAGFTPDGLPLGGAARRAPARRGDAALARAPSSRPRAAVGRPAARRSRRDRRRSLAARRATPRRAAGAAAARALRGRRRAGAVTKSDRDRPRQRGRSAPPSERSASVLARASAPTTRSSARRARTTPGSERPALGRRPARRDGQLPVRHPAVVRSRSPARTRPGRSPAWSSTRCATSASRRRAAGPRCSTASRSTPRPAQRPRDGARRARASATTSACAATRRARSPRCCRRCATSAARGSAALDLAWTAAGPLDAYYERGVKHWDVAAGALICRRVGLAIRPLPALPSTGEGIVVGAPGLVDQVAEIVAGGA